MPVKVSQGDFTVLCATGSLPLIYESYRDGAELAEEFDLDRSDREPSFIGVTRGAGWPFLTIAQRYSPSEPGFHPGVLIVPETGVLFLGAGERLLAYTLKPVCRLWADLTAVGFWHWHRRGDVILMAAELELAAFDLHGRKLWSQFVEPPWDYDFDGDDVTVDVMSLKLRFSLRTGPAADSAG